MPAKLKEHGFLFSELIKRDFKKKYKRTYLGMLWSLISPLITLFVLTVIFKRFFGFHLSELRIQERIFFFSKRKSHGKSIAFVSCAYYIYTENEIIRLFKIECFGGFVE